MNSGGLTPRILRFSNGVVGKIPGGLAHVNVTTNVIWAGISGSAIADAAAIGSIMIPSMTRAGYSRGFTSALNAAAATIGPIMPPSVPMIIYGMVANVSVASLFLAGVFPGLILALYLMLVSLIISILRGYPRSERIPFKELVKLSFTVSLAFLSPVIIVGGILLGVFTATEAGAVAVLYSFLVGFFIYRELKFSQLIQIFKNTLVSTGSVLILVAVSYLFGWIVAQSNVGNKVAELIFAISENPVIILLLLNVFFLIIGMIMDPLAALIIFVPIFLPVVEAVGISPIHFGLVIVLNLMIGLSTPPIGYLLYVTSAIAGNPVENTIKESIPFIVVMLLVLVICTLWPSMVLYLPSLIGR
jgi:tripartite ATP-independent transporter DctM subunit